MTFDKWLQRMWWSGWSSCWKIPACTHGGGVLLGCSRGWDTRASVREVVTQDTSEQAKPASLKTTHTRDAAADRDVLVTLSSSPCLSSQTNSEFSKICDLTRHFHLFVEVEWSWWFLTPNQRALIAKQEALPLKGIFSRASSEWEVNTLRKFWNPPSFFPSRLINTVRQQGTPPSSQGRRKGR